MTREGRSTRRLVREMERVYVSNSNVKWCVEEVMVCVDDGVMVEGREEKV